jgi:hypothetical protein
VRAPFGFRVAGVGEQVAVPGAAGATFVLQAGYSMLSVLSDLVCGTLDWCLSKQEADYTARCVSLHVCRRLEAHAILSNVREFTHST